jgi:hypothetical protein
MSTQLLGNAGVQRSRVVVEIDVADPTGDQHDRDVAVAHFPIGQPNVTISRVSDATDAHVAKCATAVAW